MPEISHVRAADPAPRTSLRAAPDNQTKTIASVHFGELLRKPSGTANSAHGTTVGAAHCPAAQTAAEAASAELRRQDRRGVEPAHEPEAKPAAEAALDPLICQLALNSLGGPDFSPRLGSLAAPAALPLRDDLQNMLNGLARRVAWGGDRRKGSARIELSEGALAGATLIVHAEQRSVSVELELPPGAQAQGFQERIAERLQARGFSVSVRIG